MMMMMMMMLMMMTPQPAKSPAQPILLSHLVPSPGSVIIQLCSHTSSIFIMSLAQGAGE